MKHHPPPLRQPTSLSGYSFPAVPQAFRPRSLFDGGEAMSLQATLQAIRLDVCPVGVTNVFDLRGLDFVLFYTILLLLCLACAFVLRQVLRGPGESGVDLGKGGALHPLEVAYLAGGPRAAIDAAAAALVHREVLMVTKTTHYLQPRGGPPPQDLHPLEKAIFEAASVEGGKAV